MHFFLCAHTGKGVGGRAERSRGEAAASGSRPRAGGQMRVCPLPRAPRACHFGRFHDTGRGVGSAAAPGSAGVRARVGAAEPQPGRRARRPRLGAPAGAAGAADRCGERREPRAPPLRPPPPVWPLCRARTGERASEREKYKYGRPRQWEKRPGHFLPARAAENGLVECAGASPRRVLCVCVCVCVCARAAERPPRLPPRTRTLTRTHTLTDPRRARRPRVCVFFLAASPFPTDCVRISYRSAPISAILGKLHKNKPSGLFLPEAGKCFGKRGGAGPRRPSARGRAQGAGSRAGPGARAVAAFAPRRAAPARVRARACVGRRRPRRR